MATQTILQRLRLWYAFVRSQEPATLIAFWRALLGVAIAAGVTVPDWLEPRVAGIIAAVYVVLTFWQARATRARVVPADNVPRHLWSETQRDVARHH